MNRDLLDLLLAVIEIRAVLLGLGPGAPDKLALPTGEPQSLVNTVNVNFHVLEILQLLSFHQKQCLITQTLIAKNLEH